MSKATVSSWKSKEKGKSKTLESGEDLEAENRRLRRENEELKKVNHILKRAAVFFPRPPEVKFEVVEYFVKVEEFLVAQVCRALDVNRGSYYSWLSRPTSQRDQGNVVLLARIRALHAVSDQTYGSPRITADLRAEAIL